MYIAVCTANGDKGIRTLDPLLARQVLSQLSYTPMGTSMQQQTISLYAFYLLLLCISSTLFALRMGLSGLEPPTSRLSGVRSNQLSYGSKENFSSEKFDWSDQLSQKVAFRRKVHVRFHYRTGSPEWNKSGSLWKIHLDLTFIWFSPASNSLRKLFFEK